MASSADNLSDDELAELRKLGRRDDDLGRIARVWLDLEDGDDGE